MVRRSEEEWVAEGRAIILDMVGTLDAVLWPEMVARASERRWGEFPRVDANHMLTARTQLLSEGRIERMQEPTRGGRALIDVYHAPLARGNQTRIDRAAGRKRLLYARWFGWAVGDARYPGGFIGVGGERVVRASLAAAAPHLYFPVAPGYGPVTSIFGERVQPGSLDSGAWLVTRTGGITGAPMFVPIEVKNIREWMFPHSHQIYQVLAKAATLQLHHAEQRMPPLLICRRKHIQTIWMAKDLGFMVVEVKRQFLMPSADYTEEGVEEVRAGIGFDLTVTDQAYPLLVQVLNETLPYRAEPLANRWGTHGAQFESLYWTLADDDVPQEERDEALVELRTTAMELPDMEGGW